MGNNFSYLEDKAEFQAFARSCVEAEDSLQTSPTVCIRNCRAALEKIMRWLYGRDNKFTIDDELNEPSTQDGRAPGELYKMTSSKAFVDAVGRDLSKKVHRIRMLGNDAMHGSSDNRELTIRDATYCLRNLFEFVQWIDQRYGRNFKPRTFDRDNLPKKSSALGNLVIILVLAAIMAIAAASIFGLEIPWLKIFSP